MLDKNVATQLNEQIEKELYSAYLYLDMANYYNDQGLDGFENWFYIQAQEERDHAMLLRTYLQNNEEAVKLLPIAAPPGEYSDFGDPLRKSLEHEREVTASIYRIYAAASSVGDYRTMQFLDWFVKEQGEEEKTASDLVTKFKLFGRDPKSLYAFNQELRARSYAPPSLILD